MSLIYYRTYFSVVEDNHCPISIYSRFLIALFVLGIGLTASVVIKDLSQNKVVSTSQIVDEPSTPVEGSLESFPRDFDLNLSDQIGMNIISSRQSEQHFNSFRHTVGKQTDEISDVSMGKKYPDDSIFIDDEKPSLPPNFHGVSEEELLKLGYRRHITVNGDCLGQLAEKYLHDVSRWKEIFELNRSELINKDVVPIGIVLIIPAK